MLRRVCVRRCVLCGPSRFMITRLALPHRMPSSRIKVARAVSNPRGGIFYRGLGSNQGSIATLAAGSSRAAQRSQRCRGRPRRRCHRSARRGGYGFRKFFAIWSFGDRCDKRCTSASLGLSSRLSALFGNMRFTADVPFTLCFPFRRLLLLLLLSRKRRIKMRKVLCGVFLHSVWRLSSFCVAVRVQSTPRPSSPCN